MSDSTRSPLVPRAVRLGVVVGLLALTAILTASGDLAQRLSANPWSRLATIESVVERGTWAITDSPLAHNTIDKIKVAEDFYSDKPPLLSALGALVYWPLRAIGYTFGPPDFPVVVFWITWVLVGWTFAAGYVAFRRSLEAVGLPWPTAELLALACWTGSLLLTYSVTLNNHTPAAACAAWLWCLIVGRRADGRPKRGRLFLMGLAAGLTLAIDMPTGGALLAGLVIYLKLTGASWHDLAWTALGAAGPVLGHAVLQMQVTPLPWPAQVQRRYWLYEGSYWLNPRGYDVHQEPAWTYLARLLIGPRGWLTLTPVLAWGLAYMVWAAVRPSHRWQAEARLLAAVVAGLVAYYAFLTGYQNFSGTCWGVRWFIAFTPPVLFFSCAACARLRPVWARAMFWATAGIGLAYAALGTAAPWSAVEESTDPIVIWLQRLAVLG